MNKLTALAALLLTVAVAHSADVTLSWDPSATSVNDAGIESDPSNEVLHDFEAPSLDT
jgi:hypothetical protein